MSLLNAVRVAQDAVAAGERLTLAQLTRCDAALKDAAHELLDLAHQLQSLTAQASTDSHEDNTSGRPACGPSDPSAARHPQPSVLLAALTALADTIRAKSLSLTSQYVDYILPPGNDSRPSSQAHTTAPTAPAPTIPLALRILTTLSPPLTAATPNFSTPASRSTPHTTQNPLQRHNPPSITELTDSEATLAETLQSAVKCHTGLVLTALLYTHDPALPSPWTNSTCSLAAHQLLHTLLSHPATSSTPPSTSPSTPASTPSTPRPSSPDSTSIPTAASTGTHHPASPHPTKPDTHTPTLPRTLPPSLLPHLHPYICYERVPGPKDRDQRRSYTTGPPLPIRVEATKQLAELVRLAPPRALSHPPLLALCLAAAQEPAPEAKLYGTRALVLLASRSPREELQHSRGAIWGVAKGWINGCPEQLAPHLFPSAVEVATHLEGKAQRRAPMYDELMEAALAYAVIFTHGQRMLLRSFLELALQLVPRLGLCMGKHLGALLPLLLEWLHGSCRLAALRVLVACLVYCWPLVGPWRVAVAGKVREAVELEGQRRVPDPQFVTIGRKLAEQLERDCVPGPSGVVVEEA